MLTQRDIGRRSEQGLTLVELIVAMVITMIILTIVSRMILSGMTTKTEVNADSKAFTNGNQAIEKLASDLRIAEAPGRKTATDNEILGLSGSNPDVRDLVLAREYQLQIRADVEPTAGVECVEYYVDRLGSAWRVVHQAAAVGNPTCSGAVRSEQMVAQGTDGDKAAARDTNIYSAYSEASPPALRFSYATASPTCTQVLQPTITDTTSALARVIGIGVGIRATVGTKESVKQSRFGGVVSFRSRGGLSYRTTIGCPNGIGT